MKNKILIIMGVLFLLLAQMALAGESYILNNFSLYLILVFGIFSFVAYTVVTVQLYKTHDVFGPWFFFSVIALLIMIAEFLTGNLIIHRRLVATAMFMFFFAALVRYWNILELGQ